MNRTFYFFLRGFFVTLGLWWGSTAAICYAVPINVHLDTAALSGGTFFVGFDLIDGDATVNNSATIDTFTLGGGTLLGSPMYIGAASGDLSSSVALHDSGGFLAEVVQGSTLGSVFSFVVNVTSNFVGGTPDSLVFFLLDSTGTPIPTTADAIFGPGTGTLFALDLGPGGLAIQTFSSPDLNLSAPTTTTAVVPEPSTLAFVIIGLTGWAVRRRHYWAKDRRCNNFPTS